MGNDEWDDESKVDYSDTESIQRYLEHNLEEGYLSQEEEKFVDNLISSIENKVDPAEIQKKVEQIQLNTR